MSTQLENKAFTVAQLLAANGLSKIAACQEIEKKSPEDQTNLGAEQQKEAVKEIDGGVPASTPAAANKDTATVETPPNCQNLNKTPEAALAATGSAVEVMNEDGKPAQLKTAADYKHELAKLLGQMNKKAAMVKQAAEAKENFRTGTEVMQKLAALTPESTEEQLTEASEELLKLATYNPLFAVCRDRILMTKLAEDAMALAEAEGITPDEAAKALDEAAAKDPSIMEDAEAEATGEAVADLAGAEAETDELMAGVQQLADNASQVTGQEVTPDQILAAIDDVEAAAEQMGVPPEALIQAAMEDMQAEADITPEDEANAQAILEEAAANGISPDEVLEMAAGELEDSDEGAEDGEAPAEGKPEEPEQAKEAAAKQPEQVKEASAKQPEQAKTEPKPETKTASVKVAATPRAAKVQKLMHEAKK